MKNILQATMIFALLLTACEKPAINTAEGISGEHPDIYYYDDVDILIFTHKADSFLTSGGNHLSVGYHKDDQFGTLESTAFIQLDLPEENPLKDKVVIFDSLVLHLRPTGNYFGDTLEPITIRVHRLLEKISNEENNDNRYYNTRKFRYANNNIGTKTQQIEPRKGSVITIKINDTLGLELLRKFQENHNEVRNNKEFTEFFKGIAISTDSTKSNNWFQFKPDSINGFMRLHYRVKNHQFEKQFLDFKNSPVKLSSSVLFNHTGTPLNEFQSTRKQTKSSTLTKNHSFLHSLMPAYIKLEFPGLQKLKEKYPLIKIIKAELIIKPIPEQVLGLYTLPEMLHLYTTDEKNGLIQLIKDKNTSNNQAQTGNLVIDKLYHSNTRYTFEITDFINDKVFNINTLNKALMISPVFTNSNNQRLALRDRNISKDITLRLYLLGIK
jgi:hypothetical protein